MFFMHNRIMNFIALASLNGSSGGNLIRVFMRVEEASQERKVSATPALEVYERERTYRIVVWVSRPAWHLTGDNADAYWGGKGIRNIAQWLWQYTCIRSGTSGLLLTYYCGFPGGLLWKNLPKTGMLLYDQFLLVEIRVMSILPRWITQRLMFSWTGFAPSHYFDMDLCSLVLVWNCTKIH